MYKCFVRILDSGAIHCLSFCKNSAEEFFKTRTKKRRLSRGEIISFSLLWSKSAERSILFACKNECTHFYNRGTRERSSFVRSRVKPRPVTCALATCNTGYYLTQKSRLAVNCHRFTQKKKSRKKGNEK